jgi:hypothetical protein
MADAPEKKGREGIPFTGDASKGPTDNFNTQQISHHKSERLFRPELVCRHKTTIEV